MNECADQLATRGVAGSSYSEEIPVTPVPPDEPERAEEFVVSDEEATQISEWNDSEHLPTCGITIKSVGLAAEEQREEQENMLRRFQPSPVSAILRQTMEQGPQPEIIVVLSESSSSSPRVSSKDSDSEAQGLDQDDSGVVISRPNMDGPKLCVPWPHCSAAKKPSQNGQRRRTSTCL